MSSNTNNNESPSRLLTSTNNVRDTLISRNLYTPDNSYPIADKTNAKSIINAVNSIASLITPFKSYDLTNTVYGRMIDPADQTPLTKIGLAMLGTQFAYNSMSHIQKNNLPTINLGNILNGGSLFTKNVDYKITKNSNVSGFSQFLDFITYNYSSQDNPFSNNSTNAEYIQNTGDGQLSTLFDSINRNIYKSSDSTLKSAAVSVGKELVTRDAVINRINYFNFLSTSTNPYANIAPQSSTIELSITNANTDIRISKDNSTQEYAPKLGDIDNFGKTNKSNDSVKLDNSNGWINKSTEFSTDTLSDKLIWGRNGVSYFADNNIGKLRGNYGNVSVTPSDSPNSDFKAYGGLLEYTRNLLNASEGSIVDITRKAFTDSGRNVVGFNGSALWQVPDKNYAYINAKGNQIAGKTGVRQHSILDQYDRFAKAIRYNGNFVYGGNKDSVVYNTVMPRIHPTMNKAGSDNVVNNKNLMFSIENLAVRVIGNTTGVEYGIIDDEYGSTIPASEVGQFNGRVMWFPPYNMEVSESTNSKWESTVMVGRNEPMYSYMNSERTANLSFTLIIDYPPNVKNYKGNDKFKDIADFFAFGGDAYTPLTPSPNTDNTTQSIKNQTNIVNGGGNGNPAEPNILSPASVKIHFPNDFPDTTENLTTVIDKLYTVAQYQIVDGCSEYDEYKNGGMTSNGIINISSGLNKNIFVPTGIEPLSNLKVSSWLNVTNIPNDFSQYTSVNASDCLLNQNLSDVFTDEINRTLYEIIITGAASTIGTDSYNKDLGMRRAQTAQNLIDGKLKIMFGKTSSELGIVIKLISIGSTQSNPVNSAGLTQEERAAQFEKIDTIRERYAEIVIQRNKNKQAKNGVILNSTDTQTINALNADANAAQRSKNQTANMASENVFNERAGGNNSNSGDDGGILNGFKSISGNYYYPVFHSQTPEDFHRRLTFLQQCMRQGAAKRYDLAPEGDGSLTAKNSVFGRQPICVLRIGDFMFTKMIIENLTIDYKEAPWDFNPEGWGGQFMLANVTLQMKVMGGQSLKGPIDALQNAATFNYYANSSFSNAGMYYRPSKEADNQATYINGILTSETAALNKAFVGRFGTVADDKNKVKV